MRGETRTNWCAVRGGGWDTTSQVLLRGAASLEQQQQQKQRQPWDAAERKGVKGGTSDFIFPPREREE